MNRPSVRRVATGAIAAGVSALTLLTAAPAASAQDPDVLNVAYKAVGTSFIAKPSTTVNLGPTKLRTALTLADGTFTGSLPIPPTTTTFKALGLLPTSATVTFVRVGKVTGVLKPSPVPNVTATTKYYLKLSDVKVAGLPAFVGDSCQTASPVSITVATPAGQRFNVLTGGTVAGSYTIGNFTNCGLTTTLINALVPGPNNTVSFTLSNGKLVG